MRLLGLLLATFLLSENVISFPTNDETTTEVLLVVSTDSAKKEDETHSVPEEVPLNDDPNIQKDKPAASRPLQLKSMHVDSNVTNRYAHTVISSKYANPADVAQEATFSVVLPDTAFISGFVMEVKGKTYKAYVEEKKEAKRIYQEAIASGLGAAHVEVSARDSNRFTVSVNVEPLSKVIFNLTYEELLVRKHGKYEMVINLHPGQLVKDLNVDVNINETRRLVDVDTPALRSGNDIQEKDTGKKNEYAEINKLDDTEKTVHVHFAPTIQQQKEMAKLLGKDNDEDNGIAGQFIIEYDVERDPQGGEVLVSDDGYFVHFFAPSQLKSIPKHVVFVLDVSGSMYGKKIQQVQEAMQIILEQLSPDDYFNLVEFSFGAKVWNLVNTSQSPTFEGSRSPYWWEQPNEKEKQKVYDLPPAFPATEENIKIAKALVKDMSSGGGTNIYDALKTAFNLTNIGVSVENSPRPIVIFLTDGDATDGETDSKKIMSMVSDANANGEKASLFTLAFGSDANKDFLKKISLKNSGFMRHIYEAADASLQLQDFYKQISSLLLSNVHFKYSTVQSDTLTKHSFHTLFGGGELIVCGKMMITEKDQEDAKVQAVTADGPIDFIPKIIRIAPRPSTVGQLERLWAYMTIKQLLDKADVKVADDIKDIPEKKKALDLALKYSFVTPVTSLVVVKPNETKPVATEEAQPTDKNLQSSILTGIPTFSALARPQYYPSPVLAGFAALPGPALLAGGSIGEASPSSGFQDFQTAVFSTYPTTTIRYAATYKPSSTTTSAPTISSVPTNSSAPTTSLPDFIADLLRYLPWLSSLLDSSNSELINIDDKAYKLGSNETLIEEKPCYVKSLGLSGNCTLLSACPTVYPQLVDLDAYKQYFCELKLETSTIFYSGVCCTDQ